MSLALAGGSPASHHARPRVFLARRLRRRPPRSRRSVSQTLLAGGPARGESHVENEEIHVTRRRARPRPDNPDCISIATRSRHHGRRGDSRIETVRAQPSLASLSPSLSRATRLSRARLKKWRRGSRDVPARSSRDARARASSDVETSTADPRARFSSPGTWIRSSVFD